MTEVLTSAQMRAIEAAAIATGRVSGRGLMERAGAAVLAAIAEHWPQFAAQLGRAVVLCGPGNNGGDGFVVARLLAGAGWSVQVLASDTRASAVDAAQMRQDWAAEHDITPLTARAVQGALTAAAQPDLCIDAIFGTGLSRPPVGEMAAVLAQLAAFSGKILAIDAPSGVNLDTGRSLMPAGAQPVAALTVTFHRAKRGHYLADGPSFCGHLVVADIGLGAAQPPDEPPIPLVDPRVAPPDAPCATQLAKAGGHKYSHGHAVVMGGGANHSGAARLSAKAALRVGAGLVTLAVPDIRTQTGPDAVMTATTPSARDLATRLATLRESALCIGPGLGLGPAQRARVAAVLATRKPTVLDADAITHLARDETLAAMLHPGVVLTPHDGEFARLFCDIDTTCRLSAAQTASRRAGCCLLLKGPATIIADHVGRTAINAAVYDRAAPWLATAGSGDVLAGLIAGLMARGFAPFDAACTGAWLHVEAARSFGPGLIADDLPDQIPAVLRALLR
ncbi:MAG: NAD(P)H-hydrate dehydratase [Rhodobacteraceae bacterium]|nr:NAD(P)H-hydrate dehydratase [Paracoccaceae bacterium]